MISSATRAFFSRFANTHFSIPHALARGALVAKLCVRRQKPSAHCHCLVLYAPETCSKTRAPTLTPPSHDHFFCSPIGVIRHTAFAHHHPPLPHHPTHHQAILEDSTAGKHGGVTPLTIPASNTERHRVSCHRCGNLRKRNVLCSRCPHTFCCRCSDKMREEHGVRYFGVFGVFLRACRQSLLTPTPIDQLISPTHAISVPHHTRTGSYMWTPHILSTSCSSDFATSSSTLCCPPFIRCGHALL